MARRRLRARPTPPTDQAATWETAMEIARELTGHLSQLFAEIEEALTRVPDDLWTRKGREDLMEDVLGKAQPEVLNTDRGTSSPAKP